LRTCTLCYNKAAAQKIASKGIMSKAWKLQQQATTRSRIKSYEKIKACNWAEVFTTTLWKHI
jgi:hypothetical protein